MPSNQKLIPMKVRQSTNVETKNHIQQSNNFLNYATKSKVKEVNKQKITKIKRIDGKSNLEFKEFPNLCPK